MGYLSNSSDTPQEFVVKVPTQVAFDQYKEIFEWLGHIEGTYHMYTTGDYENMVFSFSDLATATLFRLRF